MWSGAFSFREWSWSAVFVGVIASLVVQALLSMIGFGVGLLTVDVPAAASSLPKEVTWGVFTWWVVSGVISAFIGGWVAANFSEAFSAEGRATHGLLAWALATLIVLGATGFAASTSVAGSLGGPAATAFTEYRSILTPGAARPSQAQLDSAQRNLALVMLGSFIALLVGAGAAVAGSQWMPEEPVRRTRSSRA